MWKAGCVGKSLAALFFLICMGFSSASAEDLGKAIDAFNHKNYKSAFDEFSKLAISKQVSAQFYLGTMYFKGLGVPQNDAEAAKWFRQSAAQFDKGAQGALGFMYYRGLGVLQDYSEAAKWFSLSARQGDNKAQYNLACMLDKGTGVPQDFAEAVKWYTLSAEQGLADAQHNLAIMYGMGKGVKRNLVIAHKWANLSVAHGNKDDDKMRDMIARDMEPDEINEAQRLAREWKPHKPVPASSETLKNM
jgi:TPR repeat protein